MRKLWMVVLAAGFIGMTTLAVAGAMAQQEPPAHSNSSDEGAPPSGEAGRDGSVRGRMQNLSRQLNLTDAQKENIRPLLKHEMERIKEVRSNSSLTQGEARRRIRRIRQTTNQQIAEFLTPDQKKQLEEMREEHRAAGAPQGGQRGPNGGAPEPPAGPPNPPNSN